MPDQGFEWDVANTDYASIIKFPHITPRAVIMHNPWYKVYWNLDQVSTASKPLIEMHEVITLNMSLVHTMYPSLLRKFRLLSPLQRKDVQLTLNRLCEQHTDAKMWAAFNWMRSDNIHLIIHYQLNSHRIPSEQQLINTAHVLKNIYAEFLNIVKILCSQHY